MMMEIAIYTALFIPLFYVLGKKIVKGKEKTKEEKTRPSDDELREAICEILKVVDFTTVGVIVSIPIIKFSWQAHFNNRYFCMIFWLFDFIHSFLLVIELLPYVYKR